MGFGHQKYRVLLVAGRINNKGLHHWDNFRLLVPKLDPLVALSRRRPSGIRSTQQTAGGVSFGRMIWSPKSHTKWTHGSPETNNHSDSWHFLATEVWVPTWTVCGRDEAAPDVFIQLTSGIFAEQYFTIAVGDDVSVPETCNLLLAAGATAATLLANPVIVATRRYWGRSVLNNHRAWIQDVYSQIMHAAVQRKAWHPSLDIPGTWETVRPDFVDVPLIWNR